MSHAYLKFVKKADDVIIGLIVLTSSSFFISLHLQLPTFHLIKVKFGLRVDFGTLIPKFNSKLKIKCQDLTRKA